MSRGSEFDRLIWVYLRDAGGWHSAPEIARALTLDTGQKIKLQRTLRRLKAGEHVVERQSAHCLVTYGVTQRCWPYPGESLVPDRDLPVADTLIGDG